MGLENKNATSAKQNAFSQWPYPPNLSPGVNYFRMGYTVRSSDGFRWTEYVPYNTSTYRGVWSSGSTGAELYDYNLDPYETINQANNLSYSKVIARLKTVLRQQYAPEI